MNIITYHIEQSGIYNSINEHCISNYLEFLCGSEPEDIRLFTNLDYCVANLLKLLNLDKNAGETLLANRKIYLIPDNYELFYIPGKIFSITFGKTIGTPTFSFSDCSQYKEAQLVKGGYDADRAISTCIESNQVGQEVLQSLVELGLSPTTLTSPIKAYQEEVLNNLDLPTVSDMPVEVAEWFYECSHRQWVEAFQMGHWKNAYDYDIRSAYASELAKMPDLRQGKWYKGRVRPQNAILGVLRGKVSISHSLSPIMYEKQDSSESERYYTPNGSWYCYITQAEQDFIKHNGIGSFELKEGWWWTPTVSEIRHPFKDVMQYLYENKEKATGIRKEVYKRIMTGCYGKMLESWTDRFGKLFNPVWGTMAETNTRLKVAQFCLKALELGCNPIHVAVDGVLLDFPVPQVPYLGTKLGDWKMSGQSPLIVVSSGILGFGDGKGYEDSFALDYPKLDSIIQSAPNEAQYKITRPSLVSIPMAVQQNKWLELGTIYELERTIDVASEHKRYYPVMPSCGKELMSHVYESEPWDSYLLEEVQ